MGFDRKAFFDHLKSYEEKYPVFDWRVSGIDLWPLVRTYLFFSNFEKETRSLKSVQRKKGKFKTLISILGGLLQFIRLQFNSKRKYLFTGFGSHRTFINQQYVNRYFDPLMDAIDEVESSCIHVEYSSIDKDKEYYKEKRLVDGTKLYALYAKLGKAVEIDLNKFEGLDSILLEYETDYSISAQKMRHDLKRKIESVLIWKRVFSFMIQKCSTEKLFCLTYYSNAGYGAILAAREKGVTCVDMQHGSQGNTHPSYNFSEHELGFNTMPDLFWVWDEIAYNHLFETIGSNRVLLGRHPYLIFNKGISDPNSSNIPEYLILISLQAKENPLPDHVLNAIKNTCTDYRWWIRMHPRMSDAEKSKFNLRLQEFQILDKVNIDEASSFPLYSILDKCKLHLTRYSGVMFEANCLCIPTIVLDTVGWSMVKEYSNDGGFIPSLEDNAVQLEQKIRLQMNSIADRGVKSLSVDKRVFQLLEELKKT